MPQPQSQDFRNASVQNLVNNIIMFFGIVPWATIVVLSPEGLYKIQTSTFRQKPQRVLTSHSFSLVEVCLARVE